jgi:hypothetical protein
MIRGGSGAVLSQEVGADATERVAAPEPTRELGHRTRGGIRATSSQARAWELTSREVWRHPNCLCRVA